MDYRQLELQRETIFQDAVITGAREKANRILEGAEKERQKQLQQAMLACEEADKDNIRAACVRDSEREYGSLHYKARTGLLEYRAMLAARLFEDIEGQLASFTENDAYPGWLTAMVKRHADALRGPLTAYLREEDMRYAAALQTSVPGLKVQAAEDIELGGVKVSDGHRQYDETLDAKLAAEKENFASRPELRV